MGPAPTANAPAHAPVELPLWVRIRLVLRSFLIQGSWNYQTLLGTGFAFVTIPAFRHLYRTDPTRIRALMARHTDLFNSHPFLANVAVGAIIRLEAEDRGPDLGRRFKNALRGSLGSIGDQLVWRTWRPACALVGIALLLAGVPWWVAVGAFLALFNALNLALRWWGLHVGLASGFEVGSHLRSPWLSLVRERGADAGAVLAGLVLVLAIGSVSIGWTGYAAGVLAVVAGVVLAVWVRTLVWGALIVCWLIGLIFGVMV